MQHADDTMGRRRSRRQAEIQREFSQGEIVDQFPSKEHQVFLVQSPKVPALPSTVLQGPIYGVGIFRDERKARTLAKHLAES